MSEPATFACRCCCCCCCCCWCCCFFVVVVHDDHDDHDDDDGDDEMAFDIARSSSDSPCEQLANRAAKLPRQMVATGEMIRNSVNQEVRLIKPCMNLGF